MNLYHPVPIPGTRKTPHRGLRVAAGGGGAARRGDERGGGGGRVRARLTRRRRGRSRLNPRDSGRPMTAAAGVAVVRAAAVGSAVGSRIVWSVCARASVCVREFVR